MTVRIALVDTETTGLSAARERIIELAVLLLEVERDSGKVLRELGRYQGLQDPGRPIPAEAIAIHGITNSMVRGHAIDAEAARQLLAQADLVVAHNAGFDKGFVAQVLPEAPSYRWACSCRGFAWKAHFPVPNGRLQELAIHLRIPAGTAHRAMGDVETTLRLLQLPVADPKSTTATTVLGKLIRAKL